MRTPAAKLPAPITPAASGGPGAAAGCAAGSGGSATASYVMSTPSGEESAPTSAS